MFYDPHIFFCTNERPAGHESGCCKSKGADKLRNYMKARVKELGIAAARVNAAGCLDRCDKGPAVVIYPEGVWYSCQTVEDAEEILQEHVIKGGRVARLLLDDDRA